MDIASQSYRRALSKAEKYAFRGSLDISDSKMLRDCYRLRHWEHVVFCGQSVEK